VVDIFKEPAKGRGPGSHLEKKRVINPAFSYSSQTRCTGEGEEKMCWSIQK
jgi:hypothetical protein